MGDNDSRTFGGDFKRFFLRGLVVLLPSVLTLWIVVKAYQFVDNSVAQPINRGVRIALANATPLSAGLQAKFDPNDETVARVLFEQRAEIDPVLGDALPTVAAVRGLLADPSIGPQALPEAEREGAILGRTNPSLRERVLRAREAELVGLRVEGIRTWWADRWYMDLIGIGVAIIAVYSAGRLLGGYLGRRLYKRLEGLITQLPVFKQVYPSVKQVVDFLFGDDQPIKFNRVVACEYPRKGIWAVGFLTGESLAAIENLADDELVTVFIPSSPTPFTGYTITVPKSDVLDLALTVDEALRFAVSGGVLVPDHMRSRPLGGADPGDGLVPIDGATTANTDSDSGSPESDAHPDAPESPSDSDRSGGRAGGSQPSAARAPGPDP